MIYINSKTSIDEKALLALYNHTYEETKHLRSHEWLITFWIITFFTAIYSLSVIEKDLIVRLNRSGIVYLSLFILWAGSILMLFKTHEDLSKNRALLRRIEKYYGFHDIYFTDQKANLLEEKMVSGLNGNMHLIFWFLAIAAAAFVVLMKIHSLQCS